jgi:aminopeptidase-like protein
MKVEDLHTILTSDAQDPGKKMHAFISELYPICRSITGNGVRETLQRIQQHIPIEIQEVPTGTKAYDWTVPREWNVKDAYVRNSAGDKVIDFRRSNLHLLNYSTPIKCTMSLRDLKEHLFTLPDHPDWIPYRTSYYKENWGFCLSHNQMLELTEAEYEVVIETSLEDGQLTYGEYSLRGAISDEVLLYCHTCHPSLCNDNLSGIALAVFLAKALAPLSLRYSYRFLFCPGTIGSITWLSLNEGMAFKIKHGLVLACVGDPGKSTYKRTRRGHAEIDRAVTHVLRHSGEDYDIEDFVPYGYDERQFCSPGFDLPVGCFMRTPHGRFPEYHTSADNLEFVQPQYLADSMTKCVAALSVLEGNRRYMNQNPKCEPQLGKRGLYSVGGGQREMAMLWVLNLSDGNHTLLDIADRSGMEFRVIKSAADLLVDRGLLGEHET